MNTTTTQTLSTLAKRFGFSCEFGAKLDWDKQSEWQQKSNGYHCTLRYKGRQYSFDFWQGSAHTKEPDAPDCLSCLLSDSHAGDQSFEEFCSDFGYDADSRKAEQTWKACQKATASMKRLLGSDYESFLYAENDI